MLKIGVTGATGTIGQYLLKHLSQNNNLEIIALVRRSPRSVPKNVRLTFGDLLSMGSLRTLVEKSDIIVHLAARNPQTPEKDREEMVSFFGINTCATAALAKFTQKYHKRMVHVSTVSVYDLSERNTGTFDECEPLPGRVDTCAWVGDIKQDFERTIAAWIDGKLNDPTSEVNCILTTKPPPSNESIYALSKFLGEYWVAQLPNSIILRLSDVYGSDEEGSDRMIPQIMRALLSGGETYVDFGPRKHVSFIYIEDVMRAITSSIAENLSIFPKVINVAFPAPIDETTLVNQFEDISHEVGLPFTIRVQRITLPENSRTYAVKNMEHHLGIKSPTSLAQGLRQMVGLS